MVGVANRSPESTFESNIMGTWRLLEASRQTRCVERVVVASSDKAYGVQPILPYREDMVLGGLFPYDASKACTDILARSYAASFGLSVAVTRCANIYGPGDLNWSRLIPGTIRSALLAEDPIVRSDGTPERDYIYVTDAVAGYMLLAEHLPQRSGEAFNFGTGEGVSALHVINLILSAVGNPGLRPQILGSARGEIDRQCLDFLKAKRLLGWEPVVRLEDGITRSVAWYEKHLAARGPRRLQEVIG
jgi:CDP-glucose 4,6-dehydratase